MRKIKDKMKELCNKMKKFILDRIEVICFWGGNIIVAIITLFLGITIRNISNEQRMRHETTKRLVKDMLDKMSNADPLFKMMDHSTKYDLVWDFNKGVCPDRDTTNADEQIVAIAYFIK